VVVVVNVGVYDELFDNTVVWSAAYHLNDGLVTPDALADRDAVSPEHIVVPSAVIVAATAYCFTVIVTSDVSIVPQSSVASRLNFVVSVRLLNECFALFVLSIVQLASLFPFLYHLYFITPLPPVAFVVPAVLNETPSPEHIAVLSATIVPAVNAGFTVTVTVSSVEQLSFVRVTL
jgi:hypothetical protein